MQFDDLNREGVDESTRRRRHDSEDEVSVENYFVAKNGLSQQAYNKMSDDVANGDIK